jgi:HAD superfamily hydrolase (TIGR01509 family)
MLKSVIFDLDGTILDSMPVWHQADRIFLSENGIDAPADISETVKKLSIEEASAYFIQRFNLKHSHQYIINRIEQIVKEEYEFHIPLKPYTNEFLNFLDNAGIPYCIATSTYLSLAYSALNRLEIYDRFKFILTCSEIGEGKTSPLIYQKSAEMLGTLPHETAVFEDSLHCIETAANAGFYTVGVYDASSDMDSDKIKSLSSAYISTFKSASEIFCK